MTGIRANSTFRTLFDFKKLKNNILLRYLLFFVMIASIRLSSTIFRKTNISNPLMRTRTCTYQGVRNVSFSENFAYVFNGWPPTNQKCTLFENKYLPGLLMSCPGLLHVKVYNIIWQVKLLDRCIKTTITEKTLEDFSEKI